VAHGRRPPFAVIDGVDANDRQARLVRIAPRQVLEPWRIFAVATSVAEEQEGSGILRSVEPPWYPADVDPLLAHGPTVPAWSGPPGRSR
jgi:hypothetical protein